MNTIFYTRLCNLAVIPLRCYQGILDSNLEYDSFFLFNAYSLSIFNLFLMIKSPKMLKSKEKNNVNILSDEKYKFFAAFW